MASNADIDYYAANPSFRKADIASVVARDFGEVAEQLSKIVSANLAGGAKVHVRDIKAPIGAGTSNETLLFVADWQGPDGPVSRGLVLRVAPSKFQLFMDPRMGDQVRLLQTFHRTERVKVAEPLLYVDGKEPFGAPFMLMERLVGQVPVSFPPYNAKGFLAEATVEQRRTAWESAFHQLTQIATTPVEDVAFLAETEGDGSFEAQMEWWRQSARWAKVDHYPAIAELEAWLAENTPVDPPIGNMMFDANFEVAGVMDWEQVALGGALLDLGWWLYFDSFQSDGLGLERLEGLGTREETISRFQDITGIEVRDIRWYELLAGWKVAILTARKAILENRSAPNDNCNNNIVTQRNATLMGWPKPADIT
jgi:aminoglycoside phosphotransferase (APT) family kinase protein